MKRDIESDLIAWQKSPIRRPLLIRGARQVGKTFTIQQFGSTHFSEMVVINFELEPELIQCFDSLKPTEILNKIRLLTQKTVTPGKTLLFLDEVQDCPNAIRSLRYFKELLPEQHVIAAGSLLEFILNDANFRMPVGRVQSLYLKPLSFKEYLVGKGDSGLKEVIETATPANSIDDSIHQRLLERIREYMILGGMPEVLQSYFNTEHIGESQLIQTELLNHYRQDFGKYAKQTDHRYLQMLFEKIPGLVSDTFKYSKIDPDSRSREIKNALYLLEQAGLIYPVKSTSAAGLPLISHSNEKKFKVLFLDVGLMTRAQKLAAEFLINNNIMLINRGATAEQFVGQEILANSAKNEESHLFYWSRDKQGSQAEVDYIIHLDQTILPIEVKAGATGKLKSLKIFMEEKQSSLGIRISQQPLGLHENILSLPLYMISELMRLLMKELI